MDKEKPVIRFNSENELARCGHWWEKKLGISDWIIEYRIVHFYESCLNGRYMGMCDFDSVNRVAFIYLANYPTLPQNSPFKVVMENTLVHELLHIVYLLDASGTDASYESRYLYDHEHTKLEKMARTLIKVRYNLDDNFFRKGSVL